MTKTEQMEEAAWQLKLLSASDPAAAANMMRHATALALMLAGRRQRHRKAEEPEIAASFAPSPQDRRFLTRVTAQTAIDQVICAFDVDDAAGLPVGIMLVRQEDDAVSFYQGCRLWSPAGGGRTVLVPTGTQDFGHFVFRKGATMRHAPGLPAADPAAGFRRADRRMAALLRSPEVRSAGREGWMHVLGSTDGVVTTRPTRIAA